MAFGAGTSSFMLEGLWQGYRDDSTDRLWAQPLWSCGPTGATYKQPRPLSRAQTASSAAPYTNLGLRFGPNRRLAGCYEARHEHVSVRCGRQVMTPARLLRPARSRLHPAANSTGESRASIFGLNTNNYTVKWFTGEPGGSGPTFEAWGINPANPGNCQLSWFLRRLSDSQGRRLAGPASISTYDISDGSFLSATWNGALAM